MSSAAILSIKPVYANQILAGTKTLELRKSAMGLGPQDVVLVYSSAPEQQISFWFRIRKVETLPVAEMWSRYTDLLGIERDEYEAYFADAETATGLHLGEIHRLKPVPLAEIQRAVDGFVPPQGSSGSGRSSVGTRRCCRNCPIRYRKTCFHSSRSTSARRVRAPRSIRAR